MSGQTLFERVGLSLLAALATLGLLVVLALPASYLVSKKLKAGMAGMSILLLFVLLAAVLALGVFIVLLVAMGR